MGKYNANNMTDVLNGFITFFVTISIIDDFQVIKINDSDSKFSFSKLKIPFKALDLIVVCVLISYSGQRITVLLLIPALPVSPYKR